MIRSWKGRRGWWLVMCSLLLDRLEEETLKKYERYMKIPEKFFSGGKTFIVLPPKFFEIIGLGKVELRCVIEIAFFV
ncbi:hypothetical protein HMPREF2844_09235 [Neisseria sp. HMSC072F04]|nr:hypothetical protein HMPREF2844_09235 [Neisseria sp. HMSC072F04]